MYHNHWSERLSDALDSADTASSGELREIYLRLAGHYRGLVENLGTPALSATVERAHLCRIRGDAYREAAIDSRLPTA